MRLTEVRKKARHLLAKHRLLDVPVNVEALADRLGIRVIKEDLDDDVSGLLLISDHKATVGINGNHHPNRQRFTLSHEIGHYVLHRDKSNLFLDPDPIFFRDTRSSEGAERNEVEANNFAAELLMPTPLIREILSKTKMDLSDDLVLRRLAPKFGVSEQALSIQLTKLRLISI